MNSPRPLIAHRAVMDPAVILCRDRFECSMAVADPISGSGGDATAARRIGRSLVVGAGAIAGLLAAYFAQIGR